MNILIRVGVFASLLALAGCVTTSPDSRRTAIQNMKNQVLTELYQAKPDVQSQIANAAGYGVFSNKNVMVFFAGAGGGYGVVNSNRSGGTTYMRMGEVGLGIGLGAKDIRLVFVFHDNRTLNRFINEGWVFAAQADAAAKNKSDGGAIGGETSLDYNMTIYQLTERGINVQATVKGTRYWKDKELNY